MPSYDWYGTHSKDDGLAQGLILPNFPIIDLKCADYSQLASEENLSLPIEVINADLIVMTQACDLENAKADHITLCRIYALNEYLNESKSNEKEAKDLIGRLNSNRVVNMALLNRPNVNPYGGAFEDYLLVKFDETVNYPIELLQQRMQIEQNDLIKLLPPYREALSQDYGIFFMRVGSPIDRHKVYINYYKDFLSPPTGNNAQ